MTAYILKDSDAALGEDSGQGISPHTLAHADLDPLFTSAPRSGVLSAWYGHVPFAHWIISALRPKRLVELGTQNGVSYAAFCNAVAVAGIGTQCFAVDTWQGDEHAGLYQEDVYTELRAFHDRRYSAFSELIRSTFDQALTYFEDGSVDLLHIDGLHSYEAVRHDFDAWRPKLSSRAVVLIHDTNVRERDFGVWRLWEELRRDYPGFEFLHEHGLGVLAVGKEVPRAVLDLCAIANDRPADATRIRNRFAFSGRICIVEADLERYKAEVFRQRSEFNSALSESEARLTLLGRSLAEREQQLEQQRRELTEQHERVTHLRHAVAQHQDQLTTAKRTAAESQSQVTSMQQAVVLRDQHITALETSVSWRLTRPLRLLGRQIPAPLRQLGRRAAKAGWWAMTPHRIPARLRARAGAQVGTAAHNAQTRDRFSLKNIPALQGDRNAVATWYDALAPEVSIIVLNWNRSDMTLLCLEHLWERTAGHRYEIIVVDNGSRAEDLAFLRTRASPARIIALGVNRYFGEANNIGVEAARGRYVCLLNNDAFVHDNWLTPLIRCLDADTNRGAVGPRFLYPDGRLQEAGALIGADGSARQLGKGESADDPRFDDLRQVDYVSAACVLLRRAQFLAVLGFDLTWDPAYYEDVDLCLKLRLIGLETVYCPQSCVTHIENATSSDARNKLNLTNIISINKTKFVARWESFIRTAGALRPSLVPALPHPPVTGTDRPRIAIFTPYNITPGGGERYFFTIAAAFRNLGEVCLVTPRAFSRLRVLTMGRELGLELDHITQACLDDLFAQPPFDLAFVVGNEIFPPIGRIAVHNVFICQFPFPIEDENLARRWRPNWDQYETVVTYSPFVSRHVSRLVDALALPARPIEIVSPPVPLITVAPAKQKHMILHVGRFFSGGHCKRQDVLIEALRTLVDMGVEAELHLAGSIHPEAEHRAYYAGLLESSAGLPVHFHPNCSNDQLQDLYARASIYWHATGFGRDVEREPHTTEHFGISVVEAMSAGCIPVVFAAGGPMEVVEDGITGFHFGTLESLCSITRRLIQQTSPDELQCLAQAAATAARSHDEQSFKERIRALSARFISLPDKA